MDPVGTLFRLWSPFYDFELVQRVFYRRVHARLMATLEELRVPAPERALDLGCGTAQLTDDLRRRWPGVRVIGLDRSRPMLAQAVRRLGRQAPPLVVADASALPFAGGAFDLVTSSISYHFWAAHDRCLAEIRRVLAPGGRFALATVSAPLRTQTLPRMRWPSVNDACDDLRRAGLRLEAVVRAYPTLLPPVVVLVGAA